MNTKTTTPLFYLGLLSAFSLLAFDLFQPALPAITNYFNTTQSVGQLTLSLFLFVYGVSQLFWGPIIDHYGRRTPLFYSLFIFIIATFACIFAPSMWVLITGRIFQGFAVCCANNLAFSSSRDIDDSRQRAKTISYIAMIISISPIFAPVIGSYIFVLSNWQMIFWTMQGIALLLGFLGMYLMNESNYWRPPTKHLNMKRSLYRYSYLFNKTGIWRAALISSASFSCVMIFIVNASYLFIDGMGYSPTTFGSLFALIGFNLIFGNYIGIKLRDKKSLNWNIRLGASTMIIGSLIMLLLFFVFGMKLYSMAPILLINIGVSLTNPPALAMALNDYPRLSSSATAMVNTVRSIISALVAATISLFVYAHPIVFPIGMLFCSLVCGITSLKLYPLSEDENND